MKLNHIKKVFFSLMILVVISFSLGLTSSSMSSSWQLVYENNAYGKQVSGDIDRLIDAAMNGSDIKVVLHFYSVELHYQMQLSKVKVDICDRVVTGYNFDFRQNPSKKNVYSRISSYSTNGEYISIYEENDYFRNPETINVAMSWYVRD
ncbi:MAG TPA: hypothetical protein PKD67_08275 [Ignavibacteriaceae bacterium]|nr:hypothetical protein [Ignavibacteriaceae bacterium]